MILWSTLINPTRRGFLPQLRLSTFTGPIGLYDERVRTNVLKDDHHQRAALQHLQRLYNETVHFDLEYSKKAKYNVTSESPYQQKSSFFGFSSTSTSNEPVRVEAPRGVYLWGGVGCGKTFMMDLFYESLPVQKKRRVHFNNFMIDVHKRLHRIKGFYYLLLP